MPLNASVEGSGGSSQQRSRNRLGSLRALESLVLCYFVVRTSYAPRNASPLPRIESATPGSGPGLKETACLRHAEFFGGKRFTPGWKGGRIRDRDQTRLRISGSLPRGLVCRLRARVRPVARIGHSVKGDLEQASLTTKSRWRTEPVFFELGLRICLDMRSSSNSN